MDQCLSPGIMPQSLSKIYIHLIFSTKNREPILPDEIRPDLHAYMGGTLKGLGCPPTLCLGLNTNHEMPAQRAGRT
jgi:hypothetical protein